MRVSPYLVIVLISCLVDVASAAPQFVPGPGPRYAHSMSYDSARSITVMFGGHNGAHLNDTWEWDGVAWQLRSGTAPSPRRDSLMIPDTANGGSIIFGGEHANGVSNETWRLTPAGWSQLSPTFSPPARAGAAGAFHDAYNHGVLFGGQASPTGAWLADTWTWNGITWTIEIPFTQPPGRSSAAACYDPLRGRTVMFGGWNGTSLNDTWEWDGQNWNAVNGGTTAPPPRHAASLTFDQVSGRVVLFGGIDGGTTMNDSWAWDGTAWTQLSPTAPPSPRYGSSVATSPNNNELICFGGRSQWPGGTYFAETWSFAGTEWQPKLDYQTSPLNGRRYALSPAMSWHAAEAMAQAAGGHLATVRNAAEDQWLTQTFSPQWAPGSSMWIGLNDAVNEGTFAWSSGDASTFRAWAPGQPDNSGNEDYVHYLGNGWNDLCPNNCAQHAGCIELPTLWPATYVPFGTGCLGAGGIVPDLYAPPGEAPRIGSSSTLRVDGLPTSVTVPVFILGFSTTQSTGAGGTYQLPLDLAVLGWTGCAQLVSLNDSVFTITTTGYADHTITLPPIAQLAGLQFHAQTLVLYSGGAVAVSNAITGTAGW